MRNAINVVSTIIFVMISSFSFGVTADLLDWPAAVGPVGGFLIGFFGGRIIFAWLSDDKAN